ncbi:putative ABC transport system permease protein [Halospina denitrificans]|uniref:Putative ABC transport system permease protein n=1 Tax=Halospina denitrificans TaxID=332522 RepID=A0A4R7JSR8_9GAMM|nr:FtsX-like permease family protein [Halospina denitrificans]TDT40407.1 putative ABC transport system permease protein [Halospina denitrificans]
MRTLRRKLIRDLAMLRGQVTAIAIVIAAGVMTLVMLVTSLDAIRLSKDRFYEEFNFAHVFVDLKRAPERVAERVREIEGVSLLQTQVQSPVRLEVPGFDDPVRGQVLSIPDGRQPDLNQLHLREGSLPESGRNDQVLLSEPFAEAHGLQVGDNLTAIINGRLKTLSVSGVALSPEFIYQLGPGDLLPDYERFGVLWMNRRALAASLDMDGAFNRLALSLQSGVPVEPMIEAVDGILAPYGGLGAYDREDQLSHRFLSQELDQLRMSATILPTIFLGVAAFLLNVLMARIINTQRQQVAVLKAFGYGNGAIGWYYGLLTGLIVLIGCVFGVVLGGWAASGLAGVYMEYFRFPAMSFRLQPRVILLGVAIAGAAAGLGTFRAVSRAARLPPAQAMRPPAPETYHQTALERSVLWRWLSQPSRIIIRNLSRHRLKAAFSVLGISLSGALILVGSFQFNAVDHLIDTQYRLVQKADTNIYFSEPVAPGVKASLLNQPGVTAVETFRDVATRLTHGHREYRTAIQGMDASRRLRGLIDTAYRDITLPGEGLLLTAYLAEHLGVEPGDTVDVEVMEGQRRTLSVPVAGTVNEPIGMGAYMERRALNRLLREGPAVTGAWLLTDQSREQALFDRLWDMPLVTSVGMIRESRTSIRRYIEDTMLFMMGFMLLLAGSIAFAVLYNNARIAFAERARELATLRVLGFTRTEVAWILIGEIGLLTLLSIPVGWGLGTALAWLLNQSISMDLFRVPFVITHQTYAFAAAGVVLAATLSLLFVARRLYRLNMIDALKTAE